MLNGAQLLIKGLKEEGVKVVFGYPGGSVLEIYDALEEFDIKHILVRHEQGAAHAANGYARAGGSVGVCLATSGPGATNLVTGIATAYMDSIPLVVITGQVPTSMVGTDAFQEVDITGITTPITKHNYLVKKVEDIPRIIKEAFHIASTGRPGPVLIDLPRDIAASIPGLINNEPLMLQGYKPTIYGHEGKINCAAKLIKKSGRPVIIAGGGIISSNCSEELIQLADAIDAPVTNTLMGLGGFPANNTKYIGMLGTYGEVVANLAVSQADLIIALGIRFDDRVTGDTKKFAKTAKIIHIDIDPAEIGKNIEVDLPIVGDLKVVLQQLLPIIDEEKCSNWWEKINLWREKYSHKVANDGNLNVPQVMGTINRLVPDGTVVTTDVGQHQLWTCHNIKFNRPRTFISSGGLGTMGYGLPAALGAQIARRDNLVIAITGDGSFQMGLSELGTMMELDLPIKIFIFNNQCLGMVKQLQKHYCNERYREISFNKSIDYLALAKAFGAEGLRITSVDEIEPVIQTCISNNRLTIVECVVSSEEYVYPMVVGTNSLDEMFGLE